MWADAGRTAARALAWAALGLALPASSQPLYRCGNAYSQTPCAPGAQERKVFQDAPASRPPAADGLALCAAKVAEALPTAEPASARAQPLGERRVEAIRYAGATLAAHRQDLRVSVKNELGLHGAPVAYSCWLSEDQARVLRVAPLGP